MKRERKYVNEDLAISVERDFYTVEKIIDMKEQGGKRYYLVKWQDWDIRACTWEEAGNVEHLPALIRDYHKARKGDQQNNLSLKKFDYV
jgi:hypothetical protein